MIIYRPHRELLDEAMKHAVEFETVEDMKKYIVKQHTDEIFGEMVSYQDISLDNRVVNDNRIGWRDTRYVLASRFGADKGIRCIGMCATDYDKKEG